MAQNNSSSSSVAQRCQKVGHPWRLSGVKYLQGKAVGDREVVEGVEDTEMETHDGRWHVAEEAGGPSDLQDSFQLEKLSGSKEHGIEEVN